eukprot:GHRR01025674.1.p2 GENE.GHRR01025674.1~~GHRR01025674.1.p2  ORF type:complete len:162 (-),score=32.78 GHRR01025674.1:278-763(-)
MQAWLAKRTTAGVPCPLALFYASTGSGAACWVPLTTGVPCASSAAALSASMIVAAPVWPPGIVGITDASMMRRLFTPQQLKSFELTTLPSVGALPILHVPVSALPLQAVLRIYASRSASDVTSAPGQPSCEMYLLSGACSAMLRAILTPDFRVARSASSWK